tara:strand:+ start:3867 stop:4091 length:225 start_codon:yes stop_codon:yes gene_type:complete
MRKNVEIGQIVQIVSDRDTEGRHTVMNVKVKNYNEETGRIIGTKVNVRTVEDPTGGSNEIVITHRDEVRAWLAS